MGRALLFASHRWASAPKTHTNQLRALIILGLWVALANCTRAEDAQIKVWNSGSKEVDVLVAELVSKRPAPFPSGYYGIEMDFVMPMPYMTLQVSNAMVKLKKLGPPIFPALIKHLRDDRYSYSAISAAWDNWTVGDTIIEVLSDGHGMYCGYKARRAPSGWATLLSFEDYLKAKSPEKWSEWAKNKTRLEIQLDFIDWCVEKEKERGFIDEAQKKDLMQTYERGRERVRKEYAGHETP